jgi:hypothetical protein
MIQEISRMNIFLIWFKYVLCRGLLAIPTVVDFLIIQRKNMFKNVYHFTLKINLLSSVVLFFLYKQGLELLKNTVYQNKNLN